MLEYFTASSGGYEFSHESIQNGGIKYPYRDTLHAHDPQTGEKVGELHYFPPKRKGSPVTVAENGFGYFDRKRGAGSALLDEMESRHPGSRVVWADKLQEKNKPKPGDPDFNANRDYGLPTDWDAHYPKLPGSIHRGIGISLSPGEAGRVNDPSRPAAEQAKMLYQHVKDNGSIGMHWSADPVKPHTFAFRNALDPRTDVPVVLHAQTPDRKDIETRPDILRNKGVWPHDHRSGDAEVPIRKRKQVMLTGISWLPDVEHPEADENGWVHHTFEEPMRHFASVEGLFPNKMGNTLDAGINDYFGGGHGGTAPERRVAGRGKPRRDGGNRPAASGAGGGGAPAGQQPGEAADAGGAAPAARSVEFHPQVAKDLRALDKPVQKQILGVVDSLAAGDPNLQTHALTQKLSGWYSTKASRGHRIVHRSTDDGGIHVGYIGLHDYDRAIRRLTKLNRQPGPVTFPYLRNTERAPNMGSMYDQDIEPHGRYLTYHDGPKPEDGRWETGEVSFENPLHLDFGGNYGTVGNWKHRLSKEYGGRKGKALSQAVVKAGHDAIITHDEYGPSEIVDLTSFRKTSVALDGMEPHQRAVHLAQETVRLHHPNLTMPVTEESGTEHLRGLLGEHGFPRADEAFVHIHPGVRGFSSTAMDNSTGAMGVSLHPSRADYGTLTHEAAHLLHDHVTGRRFREDSSDESVHGIGYVQQYAKLLAPWDKKTPGGNYQAGPGDMLLNEYYRSLNRKTAEREIHPLPERLYHVTTAVTPALEEGLKTRQELGQQYGHGLGGGRDDTISLTTHRPTAEHLLHSLHEYHDVLNGKITPDDLIDKARNGVGAQQPYEDMVRGGNQYYERAKALEGTHTTELGVHALGEQPEGWEPHGESQGEHHQTGQPIYLHWKRPVDPKERVKARSDLYKSFAWSRQFAKGHMDPLFVQNDPVEFAKKDPSEFSLLEVRPKPGAKGIRMNDRQSGTDAGEWRALSGKDLDVTYNESRDQIEPRTASKRQRQCPCGQMAEFDPQDGWQHLDGSVSHDDPEGTSVSDLMRTARIGEEYYDPDEGEHARLWDHWHPQLQPEMHRHLSVRLPGDHPAHDDRLPMPERAQAVLERVSEGTADRPGALGWHWTDDPSLSFLGTGEGRLQPGHTPVIVHARTPPREHIEDNTWTLREDRAVKDWDHPEREVPLKRNAPVHITGISWRPAGKQMVRHDFEQPIVRQAAHPLPTSRVFGPTYGLDHRLFEGEHLRPEVRAAVMARLGPVIEPVLGDDWQRYTKVYLAGSEASEWTSATLEGNGDFDTLIGVDYDTLKGEPGVPVAHLDDQDITDALNKALREDYNASPWKAPFGGEWDLTGYCNAGSYDIRKIKPYAAYNITDDEWAVKPPHLPDWSVDKLPEGGQNLLAEAEGYAAVIEAISKMPEPFRTQQGKALWHHLHSDRGRAFSDEGEGWLDPGNLLEKALVEWGLWDKLVEWQYGKKTASYEGLTFRHEESPYQHQITAETPDDGEIGYLFWSKHEQPAGGKDENCPTCDRYQWEEGHRHPAGEIEDIDVVPAHRRKGVGRAMLQHARSLPVEPKPVHSDVLTDDGRAWMEKNAGAHGDLPELTFRHLPPEDNHPYGGADQDTHTLHAYTTGGQHAGELSWFGEDGMIRNVSVHDALRRRGIASELLNRARQIQPDVHHSDALTSDGAGWARKVSMQEYFTAVKRSDHPLAPDLPEEQDDALGTEDWSEHKRKMLDLAKNPVPGTHIWRGELRADDPVKSARETGVGIHWGVNPDTIVRPQAVDGEHEVVYHAEIEHPGEQNFSRDHSMWNGRHMSMDSEAEVRLKPGTKVKLHGVWYNDPYVSEKGYFTPTKPERMGKQWSYTPINEYVDVAHRPSNGLIDYSDVGVKHEGVLRYFTAADEGEDHRMQHRPADEEYGAPLHDLTHGGMLPEDVYTHPHYYDYGGEGMGSSFGESYRHILRTRGKPEAKVKIYRSLPAEHAHQGFRPGDWVTTSKEYARQHGQQSDSKHDWPVISTAVPAKHLWTEGNDLREYGYTGPHKEMPMVSYKGGYHQEIRNDKDGWIKVVKRRKPKTAADYRLQHRAPDEESGKPYHHYFGGDEDEPVRIYRAAPPKADYLDTDTWVTTDPDYAHQHAEQYDGSKKWPVMSAEVPAKHLYWDENDSNEFGYQGPKLEDRYLEEHDRETGLKPFESRAPQRPRPRSTPRVQSTWGSSVAHLGPQDYGDSLMDFTREHAHKVLQSMGPVKWANTPHRAEDETIRGLDEARQNPREGMRPVGVLVRRNGDQITGLSLKHHGDDLPADHPFAGVEIPGLGAVHDLRDDPQPVRKQASLADYFGMAA
jgi:GNAT superfamily N-acetyltransferase/mRNA-degrading endonuclease RelE of RelBE toxin-antitoxin system